MGGLAFPVAVGTCIAGFSIYSQVRLRERYSPGALIGVCLVLLGMACIGACRL
jgi:multidrug transporter EmrE-like cation transporter